MKTPSLISFTVSHCFLIYSIESGRKRWIASIIIPSDRAVICIAKSVKHSTVLDAVCLRISELNV